MFEQFGNKYFMRFQATAFPSYALSTAYAFVEESFKKVVRTIPISSVPENANVIASHVFYKIKVEDNKSLKLKARIAPHGNEDSVKTDLKTDCAMCPPVGFRPLLSTAALRGWRVSKLDVKSAFLQTGEAFRDVYVLPPRESSDRGKVLWLLLAAAYGLINANAKWQVQSDALMFDFGFVHAPSVPQLFLYNDKTGSVVMMLAKFVDDMLLAGSAVMTAKAIDLIDEKFKLGTVAHGPGLLRLFWLNLEQNEDMTITINADDKLNAMESYPLSRIRRQQVENSLTSIELKFFISLNCAVGWLGITSSLPCAEFASRMQQLTSHTKVKILLTQAAGLRQLKKLGTSHSFTRPLPGSTHSLSLLVFSDAGRNCDAGQLSSLRNSAWQFGQRCSLSCRIVDLAQSSPPSQVSRSCRNSCAGEASDDGKLIARTPSSVHSLDVLLIIALDCKDLLSSLSTQRNSIDKSIRADVNVIRYEFQTGAVAKFVWVPGRTNLFDPGTKPDSPLLSALQLTLNDGHNSLEYDALEECSSLLSLG